MSQYEFADPSSRGFKNILVSGGAGFIGSNFIRYLLSRPEFKGRIINLDLLTYAGNPESLADIQALHGSKRYFMEQADICDRSAVERIFKQYEIDTVVH